MYLSLCKSQKYQVSIMCHGTKTDIGVVNSETDGDALIQKWINEKGAKIVT